MAAEFHYQPGSWVWIQDPVRQAATSVIIVQFRYLVYFSVSKKIYILLNSIFLLHGINIFQEEMYLPAKVLKAFKKGQETTVRTEDGENHNLDAKSSEFCEECNPEAMNSEIQDLVNISDLNEMSILHNLRIRFKEDRIYTNISSILISVNPFKLLPLYTPAVLDMYRNGSRGLPPHVFGIAVNAYNNMLSDSADQAVVCSGESGAGKSEATKLILQFLTDVSSKASHTTGGKPASSGETTKSSTLEKQILAANPILEAFGNAKTLRNNNSSRFGKLITVNFDRNGSIIGGGIINYLLEKSRIVFQTEGERNYHIFYQLLSASDTDPQITERLKLQAPELFNFTSQSGVTHVDGISDDKDFEEVKNSMSILDFPQETQDKVMQIVASVLHFGNVKFKVQKNDNAEDGSVVANPEVLEYAAQLMGVDSAVMTKALTFRSMGTREIIFTSYNVTQAQDARDAMVKRVYGDPFQFLVNRINDQLSIGKQIRHKFIGVLDIFGFEHFEVGWVEYEECVNICLAVWAVLLRSRESKFSLFYTVYFPIFGILMTPVVVIILCVYCVLCLFLMQVNSFEQLCINFCNEKLQFHFNEHIFRMEQALYAEEGISIPGTAFVDNQPTLDLLELKGTGVFSMADEEINVPRGSDDGLLQKIMQKHAGKHPNCMRPKPKECKDAHKCFGVLHYAGPVFYNITSFLEKNKDQLHSDIMGVLSGSTVDLVANMFPQEEEAQGGHKAKAKKTLGGQFKSQLNDLIATLNSTFPHFVRCMKSNDVKKGGVFTSSRMQDQLRYAGLVEVCRIRKLGYPVRRLFDEYFKRYHCVDLLAPDLDALNKSLTAKGVLKEGEWAKGHTRMFMRTLQNAELEAAREQSLKVVATILQKNARRMVARRKYKSWKKILLDVEAAIKQREEAALAAVIDLAFELPHGGVHLDVIKRAKALLLRIREEKRVTQLLQNAIEARNIDSLKSAIAVHAAVDPPFDTPLAAEAATLLKRLEDELAMKAALLAGISARNKTSLLDLIAKTKAMPYECDELSQAEGLVARMEQEEALLVKLKEALGKEDLDEANNFFSQCAELGMETYYSSQLNEARTAKKALLEKLAKLEEERKRREEEEERERQRLAAIEAKRLEQVRETREKLVATMNTKDVKAINTVLQAAINTGVNIPEIDTARALLQTLKKQAEVKSQLQAAVKVLEVKTETGINEVDLQPLAQAILVAEEVSGLE